MLEVLHILLLLQGLLLLQRLMYQQIVIHYFCSSFVIRMLQNAMDVCLHLMPQKWTTRANDLIIVYKSNQIYIDQSTKQQTYSPNLSKVYYHFACLQRKNSMFSINHIIVPEDLKPHLSSSHKTVLQSTGTYV